jgi:hypothetical protein
LQKIRRIFQKSNKKRTQTRQAGLDSSVLSNSGNVDTISHFPAETAPVAFPFLMVAKSKEGCNRE